MRRVLVFLHRYVGLALAAFLAIAGLTGALLAWNDELDAWLNPHLFRAAPPSADAPMLDMLTLRAMTVAQTGATIRYLSLKPPEPGHAAIFRPSDQDPFEQIFVDPYTGRILGRRLWGDISAGTVNLMPFLYRLHYSLLLGGPGQTFFGIVALLWTLDCFVGAYLTFPATQKNFWRQWSKAWRLRMRGGPYKLNFDLHRAGSLWMWVMLFVLAWSSVAFNLSTVYDPVMRTLFPYQQIPARRPPSEPNPHPALDWYEARETGRRLMADAARQHGFDILGEDWLLHDPARNLYFYDVRSTLDVSERKGKTRLFFDADTGASLHLSRPTGAAPGDTIRTWITTLHRAELWGRPFQLFMTLLGLIVTVLCVTGVVIWWRKRSARERAAARRKLPQELAAMPES